MQKMSKRLHLESEVLSGISSVASGSIVFSKKNHHRFHHAKLVSFEHYLSVKYSFKFLHVYFLGIFYKIISAKPENGATDTNNDSKLPINETLSSTILLLSSNLPC